MAERMETNQHPTSGHHPAHRPESLPSFRAFPVAAGWDVERLKLESIRQRAVW